MKNLPQVRVSEGWPKEVKSGTSIVRVYRVKPAKANPYFQVATSENGKRRLRSFGDESEAIKEAARIVRLKEAGQVHALRFSNEQAASYGRAITLLKPTGLALESAAALVADAVKIAGSSGRILEWLRFAKERSPDHLDKRRVQQAVNELLEVKSRRTKKGKPASQRYMEDLRARLNRFADDFKVDIATVTTSQVQSWLDNLGLKPQGYKNFRTVLNTLFEFGIARRFVAKGENPLDGVENIKGGNRDAVEIYTPEELRRLLAAAGPDFLPALAIGAFAGLRSAEIERLDWCDIDLAGGHIVVAADAAKTARRRIVPVLPALAAWLAPHTRATGPVWNGTHREFYAAQRETAAATSVPADRKHKAAAIAAVPWKTNGLRHSFISYRLADIQNTAQVALEAGNSARVIFNHYRELVKPDAAKAWFAVMPAAPANVIQIAAAQ